MLSGPGEKGYGTFMNQLFGFCQNRNNYYYYLFDHFNCEKKDHAYTQKYQTNEGEELDKNSFFICISKWT